MRAAVIAAPARSAVALLVAALLVVHALGVWSTWGSARERQGGADFASYYYAVQVAADGQDPYHKRLLSQAAAADRTRGGVHPYFYPPPFLLAVAWAAPLDLLTAYRAWFWLDELCALLAALALWWWWRPLGPAVPVAIAGALAALTAIPNNHAMGQANLPVLLLVIGGLAAEHRGRPWVGGALLGCACMMKMSPALFVAWWLLRGRIPAVIAACVAAVVLSVASLPLVGPDVQLRFYTQVLPGFATGDYNGLAVPIDIFGNHSLPNLWHQALPSAGRGLSGAARAASRVTSIAIVVGLAAWLAPAPRDLLARAGQVGAVGVAMLLIPVYTYEHHVVFALPAFVAAAAALACGRLSRGWAAPLGLAFVIWAWDLAAFKGWSSGLRADAPALAWVVQEAKTAALIAVLGASAWIGRAR